MNFGLNIGPCRSCSWNAREQRRHNYGIGMPLAPLILLPPSEGKAAGGEFGTHGDLFEQSLANARIEVRDALHLALTTMTVEQQSRLFGVRGELLERARKAMGAFVVGEIKVMPAWQRYTGVVWDHLDSSTLKSSARSRILVPSGLYGINRATDDIVDYRLTMHVALPGIGNLAKFWTGPLTEVLSGLRGNPTIISLLPKEHARAVLPGLIANFQDVEFLAGDGKRAVGHGAKAVKGSFARHLIDHGLDDVLGFRFERWRVSRSATGFKLVAPR